MFALGYGKEPPGGGPFVHSGTLELKIIENRKNKLIINDNIVENIKKITIFNSIRLKVLKHITSIPNDVAAKSINDVIAYENIIVFICPDLFNSSKNGLLPIANIIDSAVTMNPNKVPHIPNKVFTISTQILHSIKYPIASNLNKIT